MEPYTRHSVVYLFFACHALISLVNNIVRGPSPTFLPHLGDTLKRRGSVLCMMGPCMGTHGMAVTDLRFLLPYTLSTHQPLMLLLCGPQLLFWLFGSIHLSLTVAPMYNPMGAISGCGMGVPGMLFCSLLLVLMSELKALGPPLLERASSNLT